MNTYLSLIWFKPSMFRACSCGRLQEMISSILSDSCVQCAMFSFHKCERSHMRRTHLWSSCSQPSTFKVSRRGKLWTTSSIISKSRLEMKRSSRWTTLSQHDAQHRISAADSKKREYRPPMISREWSRWDLAKQLCRVAEVMFSLLRSNDSVRQQIGS